MLDVPPATVDRLEVELRLAVILGSDLVVVALAGVRVDRVRLTITVMDDGRGGATVLPGHGLDGVRRCLAAFDSTLSVTSPTGGPTVVRIETPRGS